MSAGFVHLIAIVQLSTTWAFAPQPAASLHASPQQRGPGPGVHLRHGSRSLAQQSAGLARETDVPPDAEQEAPYIHHAVMHPLASLRTRALVLAGFVGFALIALGCAHLTREHPSKNEKAKAADDIQVVQAVHQKPRPSHVDDDDDDAASQHSSHDIDSCAPRSESSASPPSSGPGSPTLPEHRPQPGLNTPGGRPSRARSQGKEGQECEESGSPGGSPRTHTRRAEGCGELRRVQDEIDELTHELAVEHRDAFKKRSCTRSAAATASAGAAASRSGAAEAPGCQEQAAPKSSAPAAKVDGELRSLEDEMAALTCDLTGDLHQ